MLLVKTVKIFSSSRNEWEPHIELESGSYINTSKNTVVNWQNIDMPETFIGRRIMQRYTAISRRNLAVVTGCRFSARPLRTMVRFHLPLSLLISPLPCPTAGVKQINVAVTGVNDEMQCT